MPAIFVRTPYNFNWWDVRNGAPADMTSRLDAIKRGITLPAAMAPFTVAIAPIGIKKSNAVREAAEQLYAQLVKLGIEVLVDDRDERPGVMFADLELIGIPHRLVVSERSLKQGEAEYKGRRDAGRLFADGFADFIVGAEGYNSDQGRAYLYRGAAAVPQDAPNLTLTMNQFRGNVTDIIVKGVDGVSANTEKAIAASSSAAASSSHRAPEDRLPWSSKSLPVATRAPPRPPPFRIGLPRTGDPITRKGQRRAPAQASFSGGANRSARCPAAFRPRVSAARLRGWGSVCGSSDNARCASSIVRA